MEKRSICKMIDDNEIEKTRAELPPDETILRLSEFFAVFADSTRLKIIYYLSKHELCVADLATLVQMGQSAVSHQLKLLRLSRLVKYRKVGTSSFYSLDDEHVHDIFKVALQHLVEGGLGDNA